MNQGYLWLPFPTPTPPPPLLLTRLTPSASGSRTPFRNKGETDPSLHPPGGEGKYDLRGTRSLESTLGTRCVGEMSTGLDSLQEVLWVLAYEVEIRRSPGSTNPFSDPPLNYDQKDPGMGVH